jgi:hypothetical protein
MPAFFPFVLVLYLCGVKGGSLSKISPPKSIYLANKHILLSAVDDLHCFFAFAEGNNVKNL